MNRNMNTQMGYGDMGWGSHTGGLGFQGPYMPYNTPGYGYPGMGAGYGPTYGQHGMQGGPGYMPTTGGMGPGMSTPGYGMTPPQYGMSHGYGMPNYPGAAGTQPGLEGYGGNSPYMTPGMNPTTGHGKSGYFGTMEDLDDQDMNFQPGTPNYGYPSGLPYGY